MKGWKHKKTSTIIGNEKTPTKMEAGQVIINKKATKKYLDKLIEINNDGLDNTSTKVSTDGTDGGILKGKPHYDENGNPTGGIPVIVDGGKKIEVEGDEFVVNKEASQKHWKELSRINQSAGNGVPINPSDVGSDEDPEEFRKGGIIEFNPNHLPNHLIYSYAKKVKEKYPKVWDMGGNIFGNEAFKNLERVIKRGYWTENEEWMYIKWRSYVARHHKDFRIAGTIAMLKWVDKTDKGWPYMKALIEKEIAKKYPKKGWKNKMAKGGGITNKLAFISKNESGNYWLISINKKGDNYEEIDGDRRLYVVKDMAKRWGYKLVSPKEFNDYYKIEERIRSYDSQKKMAEGGGIKIMPQQGTLLTKDKKLKLDYKRNGNDFEFVVYEGENNPVANYTKTSFKKKQNGVVTMDYNQFIDYIYSEGYIDDKNYALGGGIVTYKNKYNKKYGYDKDERHDLKDIAKDTGVSEKGLQQIYNKGVGAYKTNPQSVRPTVKSKEQWAMARVYSAVMGGKAARVDANELKMENGGGIEYSAIQEILNKAKPFQDELTERWVKAINEEGKITLTDWDIQMYQFSLVMDLTKAIGNYLEKDDLIKDLKFIKDQSSIVISCVVIRDGVEYNFSTEVILAGGYNIQKLHLRYIVHTKLDNKRSNPEYDKLNEQYKRMTKAQKLKEQISFSENAIAEYEVKLNEAKANSKLSDSEVEKLSRSKKPDVWKNIDITWEIIIERGADKNFNYDKSEFERRTKENKEFWIQSWKTNNSNYGRYEGLIKSEKKQIEKLNKKIAELGVTKMQTGGGIEFMPEKKGTLIRGNEIIKYFEKVNGNYRLIFYTLNETKGKVPTMCDSFGYCEELDSDNVTPKELVELIKKNNLMQYGGMMQGEPPANFENVLYTELANRYKHGGNIVNNACIEELVSLINSYSEIEYWDVDKNKNNLVIVFKNEIGNYDIDIYNKFLKGLSDCETVFDKDVEIKYDNSDYKTIFVKLKTSIENGGAKNIEFMKWFVDWYKTINKQININFSVPNILSPFKEDNVIILDLFEKINQDIDAKPYLNKIIEKADDFGVVIYLEPTPRYKYFLENAEKRKKISKDYLIKYYKNFGFELTQNGQFMKRVPKMKNGGTVKDITCTQCGWAWNKSDSEKHDEYVCHKCGTDNKNNMYELGGIFHGSPYKFEKFTTEKIGTGEGAQAFGWGLYFTDLESIGESYAKTLAQGKSNSQSIAQYFYGTGYTKEQSDGIMKMPIENQIEIINNAYERNIAKLNKKEDSEFKNHLIETQNLLRDRLISEAYQVSPFLYKVTLFKGKKPEDYNWLEWNKPISEKNKNKIVDGLFLLVEYGVGFGNRPYLKFPSGKIINTNIQKSEIKNYLKEGRIFGNGSEVYDQLSSMIGSQKETSLFLLKNGIDGVKYPAESISKGKTDDNAKGFNYVVFDENAVAIDEIKQFKNGGIANSGFIEKTLYDVFNGKINSDDAAIQLDESGIEVDEDLYDKLRDAEKSFLNKNRGLQVGDTITVKGKHGNSDFKGNFRGFTNEGKLVVVYGGGNQMLIGKDDYYKNGGTTDDFDWESLFNPSPEEEEKIKQEIKKSEEQEKEDWYQGTKFSKEWAATYKDAINKTVKEYLDAKATYEDWGSRQYKSNKGVVYAGGDDIHGTAYTIGGINEYRRKKTMAGAKMLMDESIETLKDLRLTDEEISNLLNNKMAKGGITENHEDLETQIMKQQFGR